METKLRRNNDKKTCYNEFVDLNSQEISSILTLKHISGTFKKEGNASKIRRWGIIIDFVCIHAYP